LRVKVLTISARASRSSVAKAPSCVVIATT
jgi:hypothetical protein